MPQYRAAGINNPQHMQAFGNALNLWDVATIPANLTTADSVDLIRIPAGTTLTDLAFVAGDLDTGTTLTANIGWRSASGAAITVRTISGQSTASANATAFASALTQFQSAQASGARLDLAFTPITFNDDVFITLIPAANGTGISGTPTVTTLAKGQANGVK